MKHLAASSLRIILIKRIILYITTVPGSFLIRVIRPLCSLLRRIYYLMLLKADIGNVDVSVQCDGRIHVEGTRNVTIKKRSRLGRNTELRTVEQGSIHLGEDTRINKGCTLVSYSSIFIDDYVIIGEYVSIRDADHGMDPSQPMRYQNHTCAPIHIGRDVWIGRGSCILPGVTIGEGCVIGANSVVNIDIPSYSIAAGVPAKVIKKRS